MMMNEVRLLIVTGSSSGLGLATSKQLLEQNFHVMGIDKDPPKIQHCLHAFGNGFSTVRCRFNLE